MSSPSAVNLPLSEVRRAAHDVHTASRRLARVPALAAALGHLDTAAGALLLAEHALQGYAVSTRPPPQSSTVDTAVPVTWWTARIAVLTGVHPSPVPAPDLLDDALARAQDGDRDGLAAVLAGADPTDGLGLAARTAPYVQHYADRAERPSAALDTVRELLPGLPPGVAEAVLAGAPDGPWDGHPADRAVAGTVLLAGLLNLLGHKGLPGD